MTIDEYNRNAAALEQRFPPIVLRPSFAYVIYKEFLLISVCIGSLVLASIPGIYFKMFFVWVAALATVMLIYQMSLIKSSRYLITHDRIICTYGVVGASGEKIELYRVKDVSWRIPTVLRPFGYGFVVVNSTDYSRPTLVIPGVKNPDRLMTIISDRVEINRIAKRVYEFTNR